MNYEDLSFPLETPRRSAIESLSNDLGDVARFGKPSKRSVIEDNGLLSVLKRNVDKSEAAIILEEIYQEARNLEKNEDSQVGAAAASVMLTDDGVTVRSAGDSAVLVVGDNGRVKLLNDFHVVKEGSLIAKKIIKQYIDDGKDPSKINFDQMIIHKIAPGQGVVKNDFTDFVSWEDLETEMGTDNVRVMAVSDGIYGLTKPENVAAHVKDLLFDLSIDDPEFSKKAMIKTLSDEVFKGKKDDVVILSAKRPEPNHAVLLHALDGIGSGLSASAVFAADAVDVAKRVMQEHKKVDIYLGGEVSDVSVDGRNTSKNPTIGT